MEPGGAMLEFLEKYSRNIFSSQWGEEGVLIEIARRMNITQGVACEIGGADGLYCANTALLIRDYGWSGTFVESDLGAHHRCKRNWLGYPKVSSVLMRVGPENVNNIVPDPCDLLSIDVDGNDYAILNALQSRPKIVIVEIDSSIPLHIHGFNPEGAASFRAMTALGIAKHFRLLCHTGNLVFCDEQHGNLFPEIDVDPLQHPERYFNPAVLSGDRSWLNR
jgi:hypothetical protein